MLACVTTFALEGVSSHEVTVEVDVRRGLSAFTLVGLPDRAVRESRERVRAALLNSGLDFPQKRITVNLAPARPSRRPRTSANAPTSPTSAARTTPSGRSRSPRPAGTTCS
jgi:hypothetical protein